MFLTKTDRLAHRPIGILIVTLLFLACFASFSPARAGAQSCLLKADQQYNVGVGKYLEIPVHVTNVPGMAAYYFDLHYDPDVVVVEPREGETVAVKLGAALSGSSPIVNLNDAKEGVIRVAWMDLASFTGSGEICRITFKMLSAGATALKLENVELVGGSGRLGVNVIGGFISADPPPSVTRVSIVEGNRNIEIHRAFRFSLVIEPDHVPYREINWSTSDPRVATVSSDGLVMAQNVGTARITANVSTAGRDYSDSVTVTVVPAPESPVFEIVSPRELPHGYRGSYYSYSFVASGGAAPYRWSRISGSLPPGLSLTTYGELYGTPTSPGRYSFTLRARDNKDDFKDREFVIWLVERDYYSYEPGSRYPPGWGSFENMTISHGSMEIHLQPHQFPFMMVVGRNTSYINVRTTLVRSGDRLMINGTSQSSGSSRRISLHSGTNTIDLVIRPAYGTTKNYTIAVFKIP